MRARLTAGLARAVVRRRAAAARTRALLPLELLAWRPRVLQEQQLLPMLLCRSSSPKAIQNMRTLLLVVSADYLHHLLRGTRSGTARTRRVAFVRPFYCSCEHPGRRV